MSRFSGRQGKGALKAHRNLKRSEASTRIEIRNMFFDYLDRPIEGHRTLATDAYYCELRALRVWGLEGYRALRGDAGPEERRRQVLFEVEHDEDLRLLMIEDIYGWGAEIVDHGIDLTRYPTEKEN